LRKAARIVFLLLLSYLVQATMLTYFRIGSVVLDIVVLILFTSGFACGMYAGFVTGLLGALLLEVLSGDLPGLSSIVPIAAGIFGAYVAGQVGRYQKSSNKRQERLVKRIAPPVALSALVMAREGIFIAYFYLTGADISVMHLIRAFHCAAVTGALALLLMPALAGFMTRDRKKTLIARWRRRRRNRKLPKRFGPVIELPKEDSPAVAAEHSMQFPTELPPDLYDGIIEITAGSLDETPADEGETEAE
jgi:hypothetical protein